MNFLVFNEINYKGIILYCSLVSNIDFLLDKGTCQIKARYVLLAILQTDLVMEYETGVQKHQILPCSTINDFPSVVIFKEILIKQVMWIKF